MLNQQALLASLPLTERLDAAGCALYPVEGTPLAALCGATRSDAGLFDITGGDPKLLINYIESMANQVQPEIACSEHDAVLDPIAGVAIEAVKHHIAFARSVVAPAINDLYGRVCASLKEISASSLLGMEIDVLREPKPLDNSALQAAIRKFDEVPFDSPALTLKMPDLTGTELVELMSSGGGGLDADIAEWVAEKGEGFFLNLWTHLFQQHFPADGERLRSFAEWMTCRETGVDNALAVFLIARKLVDDKPLAGAEMSLSDYRQRLVEFRNQSGAALARALNRIERAMKAGHLVRDVIDAKTVVYEPVYRRFLEEGGTNEMLFANALGSPPLTSLATLLEQKARLAEVWTRHSLLTKTAESNQRFNKTKELLELHFRSQLAEVTEGEEASAANREIVIKLFRQCLLQLRESDLNDLQTACLKLVCRARFYQTDAERILMGIEQARKDNPTISVREAAAASIVDYIAHWLSTQLRIDRAVR